MNLTINQYIRARYLKDLHDNKQTPSNIKLREQYCNGVFEWLNEFLQKQVNHKRCLQNSNKFYTMYVVPNLKKFEDEYQE
jgi:hypothetical protein